MRISDWSADVCSVDLQGQVVRLLRRPDDEGDAGQGQSAGGQRAVEEGAGMNLLALASVLMLAAVPAVAQDAPGRTPIAEAAPQSDAHLPRVAIDTRAGTIVVALDTERAPVTANNSPPYADQNKSDGDVGRVSLWERRGHTL